MQTTGQLFIRENSLKCQPFPRCKGVETADISDYVEMFSYGLTPLRLFLFVLRAMPQAR